MKCGSFYAQFRYRALFAVCIGMLAIFYSLPVHAASAQGAAYVRVIHASPYVGTADVFVDGKQLLSSFQFGAVTDYVPLPAGTHRVQIALVGKGINASVITQDLPVTAGYAYTVAALGTNPNALSLQVFVDNNLVTPNQAKVRIYYLSPDAGNATANVGGGDAIFSSLTYPSASSYVNETTGLCPFSFDDLQHSAVLPLSMSLHPNTIASVFAIGLFGGNPKVQLVEANSPGVPGLPGTGSDPVLVDSVIAQPLVTWLLIAVLLALISVPVSLRLKRKA